MSKNRKIKETSASGGDRRREVLGVIGLGAALFLLVAMISLQAGAMVMGPFGKSSAAAFYGLGGVCGYALVGLGLAAALRTLLERHPVMPAPIAAGVVIGAAALATLLHLAVPGYRVAGHGPGGLVGARTRPSNPISKGKRSMHGCSHTRSFGHNGRQRLRLAVAAGPARWTTTCLESVRAHGRRGRPHRQPTMSAVLPASVLADTAVERRGLQGCVTVFRNCVIPGIAGLHVVSKDRNKGSWRPVTDLIKELPDIQGCYLLTPTGTLGSYQQDCRFHPDTELTQALAGAIGQFLQEFRATHDTRWCGGRTPGQWALYGVGLAATVAVTVLVTRIARRALERRI